MHYDNDHTQISLPIRQTMKLSVDFDCSVQLRKCHFCLFMRLFTRPSPRYYSRRVMCTIIVFDSLLLKIHFLLILIIKYIF
uniref:Uncharacterized protein n=1 Tax=Octopus bimaculoides TaxID=37653 RepID=A0A0L8I8L0_OCTBM